MHIFSQVCYTKENVKQILEKKQKRLFELKSEFGHQNRYNDTSGQVFKIKIPKKLAAAVVSGVGIVSKIEASDAIL